MGELNVTDIFTLADQNAFDALDIKPDGFLISDGTNAKVAASFKTLLGTQVTSMYLLSNIFHNIALTTIVTAASGTVFYCYASEKH